MVTRTIFVYKNSNNDEVNNFRISTKFVKLNSKPPLDEVFNGMKTRFIILVLNANVLRKLVVLKKQKRFLAETGKVRFCFIIKAITHVVMVLAIRIIQNNELVFKR